MGSTARRCMCCPSTSMRWWLVCTWIASAPSSPSSAPTKLTTSTCRWKAPISPITTATDPLLGGLICPMEDLRQPAQAPWGLGIKTKMKEKKKKKKKKKGRGKKKKKKKKKK